MIETVGIKFERYKKKQEELKFKKGMRKLNQEIFKNQTNLRMQNAEKFNKNNKLYVHKLASRQNIKSFIENNNSSAKQNLPQPKAV